MQQLKTKISREEQGKKLITYYVKSPQKREIYQTYPTFKNDRWKIGKSSRNNNPKIW